MSQTFLPASSAGGVISRATVPTVAISGQPFATHVVATLTNTGAKLSGNFLEQLYIDTASNGLSANAVQIFSKVARTALATRHKLAVSFVTRLLPASVPVGTYHLVAKITDPLGNVDLITLPNTVQVAAPVVLISAAVKAVHPAKIAPGRLGATAITITNIGNVPATATLSISLAPTADGVNPILGVTLVTLVKRVTLKAGKHAAYPLRFKIPTSLATGSYSLFAAVTFAGASTTAVSPISFTVS